MKIQKTLCLLLIALVGLAPSISRGQDGAAPAAAAPPPTLWQFLGVTQALEGVRNATVNRRGNRPKLERPAPPKPLGDPSNLSPKWAAGDLGKGGGAVEMAAKVKQSEDAAAQKIKAVKYLASIGCGCYKEELGPDKFIGALVGAMSDCTESVRLATVEAIAEGAEGESCEHCGTKSCCDEAIVKKLAEMAYALDSTGCYKEKSERVREAAIEALCVCCPNEGIPEIVDDMGTEGTDRPRTDNPDDESNTPTEADPDTRESTDSADSADVSFRVPFRQIALPAEPNAENAEMIEGRVRSMNTETGLYFIELSKPIILARGAQLVASHAFLTGDWDVGELTVVSANKRIVTARLNRVIAGRPVVRGDSVRTWVQTRKPTTVGSELALTRNLPSPAETIAQSSRRTNPTLNGQRLGSSTFRVSDSNTAGSSPRPDLFKPSRTLTPSAPAKPANAQPTTLTIPEPQARRSDEAAQEVSSTSMLNPKKLLQAAGLLSDGEGEAVRPASTRREVSSPTPAPRHRYGRSRVNFQTKPRKPTSSSTDSQLRSVSSLRDTRLQSASGLKTKTLKTETLKTESLKTESLKTESLKTESTKTETPSQVKSASSRRRYQKTDSVTRHVGG